MDSKRNKKLCWNCEGEVDKDALFCLYCGTDLTNPPQDIPSPPYAPREVDKILDAEEAPAPSKDSALPLILILAGSLFFAFSLFLAFFSTNDVLVLKWDASYWFVYLMVSFPLLFLGYRLTKE